MFTKAFCNEELFLPRIFYSFFGHIVCGTSNNKKKTTNWWCYFIPYLCMLTNTHNIYIVHYYYYYAENLCVYKMVEWRWEFSLFVHKIVFHKMGNDLSLLVFVKNWKTYITPHEFHICHNLCSLTFRCSTGVHRHYNKGNIR